MKFSFTFLFLLIVVTLSAQDINTKQVDTIPINSSNGKIALIKVIDIPNTSKEDIYKRLSEWHRTAIGNIGKNWLSKKTDSAGQYSIVSIVDLSTYGNAADTSYKEKDKISYKITLSNYYLKPKLLGKDNALGDELSSFIVLIKDNKVKFEFTDFIHILAGGGGYSYPFEEKNPKGFSKNGWEEFRVKMLKKFQGLSNDIEKQLKAKSEMDF